MDDLFGTALDYGDDLEPEAPPPPPEFNEDEARPNNNSAVVEMDSGVHASLKALGSQLDSMRSPDGSRHHPARTCQDLNQCYPLKKSG